MNQDLVLFHRLDGVGEPLLLLNGIAMTTPSWEAFVAPLTVDHQLVRCDFRGQLLTPGPPPDDVGEHVEDLVRLLDHLELDSVHVAGTSFGGVVGALFAARHPDRVRSLVCIASADGFDEQMAGEVARWREACLQSLEGPDRGHLSDVLEPVAYSPAYLESHREERVERRRQIAALPDAWFEGLIGLLDTAHSFRARREIAGIRCPVLVVAAELDAFVPLERARAMAERIPGARFRVVEGAGHAVVVERPELIAELILEFLATHTHE